jgi:hypothetical protein
MEDGMRTIVRVLAQALALALVLGASVGHAQSAPNRARARELYAQGQQLFRQGEFQSAQRAFEEAYRAVPNPVVLLSIAECQVRNEDFGAALTSLRQYLSEKPTAPDRAQVEAQIANLEAKPGFLSLESAPTGAMIWVDGENTGYITPNELSLRAGPHTIALSADGYQKFEQRVDVAIGSRQRLSLTLTPEAAPTYSETTPEPEPVLEQQQMGERGASPAVWAAIAVAGVTAITGTGLGVAALSKEKDYEKRPTKELRDKGERLALFADVNFGIAAVAGITAVVIYLTSAEPQELEQQAWSITPEMNQREIGLAGRLRF